MSKLRNDNPYFGGKVIDFGDNEQILTPQSIKYTPQLDDTYLTLSEGDTLSNIAYEKYGNSKQWHIIYNANRLSILDPFEIPIGVTIIIPNLTTYKSIYQ
jgi:nucleoid-associated protein YgaU